MGRSKDIWRPGCIRRNIVAFCLGRRYRGFDQKEKPSLIRNQPLGGYLFLGTISKDFKTTSYAF